MFFPDLKVMYISIDGEFTGGIPGAYSMISMAAVAYDGKGCEIGRYKANLSELPNAGRDPKTMNWWKQNSNAWELATRDPVDPKLVMQGFDLWLREFGDPKEFIGWPISDDYMFFTWYYESFLLKDSPLRFKCIDIKSYALRAFKRASTAHISRNELLEKFKLPSENFSHDPLEDARHQAQLFFAIKDMDGLEV